jgi:hypothetical protein
MLREEIIYFYSSFFRKMGKMHPVDEKKAPVCHLVLFYCSVLLTQLRGTCKEVLYNQCIHEKNAVKYGV